MKRKYVRQCLLLSALVGTFMIPGNMLIVHAAESQKSENSLLSIAGIETVPGKGYETNIKEKLDLYLVPSKKGEYLNRAFSRVDDYAYVRNAPNDAAEWIGKIYSDSTVTIIEYDGEWAKICSGSIKGYVKRNQLYTGEEAAKHEDAYKKTEATVTADVLNVRKEKGTDSEILTQVIKNQKYEVSGDAVNGWYPIKIGDQEGWVFGKYIVVKTTYSYAESKEEEEKRLEKEKEENYLNEDAREAAAMLQAEGGQAVIDFACQFIGNPYVWGGTSLTNGADCSGFVQSVYQHFGISLPRTTWDMESVGKEVCYEEALPGDLVLYDGHVGLYMGDGMIVNAMNEEQGIGICSATYTPIITIRRIL